MVGHCIRFWPAYAKAREVMLSGEYGAVRYAHFERKSPKPNWSWQNWIIDEDKSGGAVLDLHIHDTDYVLHAFGPPQQVCAAGLWEKGEGFGQMTALYDYGEGLTVLVEGGWAYKETFPFRMRFTAALDSATLEFDSSVDMNLRIHTDQGAIETPALPAADGYAQELAYFTECVERGQKPATVTAESSLEAMEAIQRECQAAAGGVAQPVP
jgi:predicted dehydrogenase